MCLGKGVCVLKLHPDTFKESQSIGVDQLVMINQKLVAAQI